MTVNKRVFDRSRLKQLIVGSVSVVRKDEKINWPGLFVDQHQANQKKSFLFLLDFFHVNHNNNHNSSFYAIWCVFNTN